MPYSAQHKAATRERIIECARQLFNRKGFVEVSIDEVMTAAGLTRGGFYNHFDSKEDLFVEAVAAYGRCRSADRWEHVELDFSAPGAILTRQLINAYLSHEHLADPDYQCPMIALPSDVARASPRVKAAYRSLLETMAGIFQGGVSPDRGASARERGLALAALCVGGMVLARTFEDADFAREIREAARTAALDLAHRPLLSESSAA